MVASLCGLRELIRRDPAPYRNLVHYFTNILKQARGPRAPPPAAACAAPPRPAHRQHLLPPVLSSVVATRAAGALRAECSRPSAPCISAAPPSHVPCTPPSPPHPAPPQAAEGKLGRAYEYHRAPAPFVQLELLRLLAALGAGDRGASENMYAVIAEVKRRAEPLGNNIGELGGGGRLMERGRAIGWRGGGGLGGRAWGR